MRWLWLGRMDDTRSWLHLPDVTERPVEQLFSASIFIELGDGNKALFWTDRWVQGKSLLNIAPCLCNAVGSTIKKHRTVAQALQGDLWIQDITGALTVQVILEYLHVWDITRETQLSQLPRSRGCHMLEVDFGQDLFYLIGIQDFLHWTAICGGSQTPPQISCTAQVQIFHLARFT